MKLYDCEMAPNPRRVRIFLAEKKVELDIKQINILEGENLSEEYLSIWSFCFFRGIPAVSVIKYFLSFASKFSSILSLVVPGTSETVDLSLFSKALNKVDFPAFGLPIIVKEVV